MSAEFLLAKASYKAMTGREQKQGEDVLCYQIRQSFYPGEITPEEANRVSYELAMRWTKGRHAFIVTTHTDKEHMFGKTESRTASFVTVMYLLCRRQSKSF